MERMTGSQILIETLCEQGVTDIFGYPGGQVLSIYDEIYKASDRINHILTAHEQGAAHAADGYARATGKVGVVISTSGPGATNLVTGIATAMLDSIPMVAITGNVPTYMIGKDAFQEVNITGVTMPITKHNFFVSKVENLADIIRRAFQIAKSGRPGPVLVDIPQDIQHAKCYFEGEETVSFLEQDKVSNEAVAEAAKLINKCKNPYIIVGGGASRMDMTDEVSELARKTDAAIGATLMGLSVIPDSEERFLGMVGMHGRYASSMANKEADLIIAVGMRFSDRATGNTKKYCENAKIIHLDADLAEVDKNVKADVKVVGDIKDALQRITEKVREKKRPSWQKQIEKLKEEEIEIISSAEGKGENITPKQMLDVINEMKNEDTVIVTDVGQHQMWTAQFIKLYKKKKFASSGGLGTMGYGLGAAIGAAIGSGEKSVLITGDGSFSMNLNELATVATYNIPVVIVIVNNGVLGMVRQWQTLFYNKRYSGSVLDRKTDYVKLSEAFGVKSKRAETKDEFKKIFEAAMKEEGPFVIDVVINENEFVLPMLPPGGSIDDIIVTKEEEN